MCQNEDIVAIDAKLVGWGNGVRYGRGTNTARCSKAGHKCGPACSRAPFFCVARPGRLRRCSGFQSSKKLGRRLIDIQGRPPAQTPRHVRNPVIHRLRRLVLAGHQRVSDHLLRFRQPQHRSHPHVFPIASVLIGVGKNRFWKSESWDPFSSSTYAPSADLHGTPKSGTRLVAARAAPGLWLAIGATCGPGTLARRPARAKHAAKEPKLPEAARVRLAYRSKVRHPPYEPFPSRLPI